MTKLNSFPIVTTDNKATETQEGLCPTLSADVADVSGSTSAVVSEYGIRKGIADNTLAEVTGQNIGNGEGIFVNQVSGVVRLKSVDTQTDNRIVITSGNGQLNVYYDGSGGGVIQQVSGTFVQGGANQMWGNFPSSSGFDSGTTGLVSGYSSVSIPVCANMQNTSLSGSEYLSGLALFEWNKDIAIGKIGVRIPINRSFVNSGEIIWIGTSADYDKFGYFTTRTSGQIQTSGEWVPLTYSMGMYEDQFEYFTTPDSIYAYTTGATFSGILSSNFDVRVFYDQVNYQKDEAALLVGGHSDVSQTDSVEVYNLFNNTNTFRGTLNTPRSETAINQNETHIYVGGGFNNDGRLSSIEKFTKYNFTGTSSTLASTLNSARQGPFSGTNGVNAYWGGGSSAGPGTGVTTIDRMPYATETVATNIAQLFEQSTWGADCHNERYVWIAGGKDSSYLDSDIIQKYDMDNDTSNAIDRLDLISERIDFDGFSTDLYGYFTPGRNVIGGTVYVTTIQRFTLASDTGTCVKRGDDVIARSSTVAFRDNSQTSAWSCYGSNASGQLTLFAKFELANETNIAIVSSGLKNSTAGIRTGMGL